MNKTPFAIIAMIAIATLGGYVVYNRLSLTTDIASDRPPVPLDAKVKSTIDDLCQKWDQVEKLTVVIQTRSPQAAGMSGTTNGVGKYAYQKTDSDPLIRLHLRNVLTIDKKTTLPDGRLSDRMFTEVMLYTLHDGKALWSRITKHEFKKVYKRNYDPAEVLQLGGRALWDTLVDGTVIKLLPDQKVEKVNDTDAFVFSVTPLSGEWSSIHWFDKETGLRIQTEEKDADGEISLSLWLEDINFAPEIPEDRFVFEIPAGYDFIDETGEKGATQDNKP